MANSSGVENLKVPSTNGDINLDNATVTTHPEFGNFGGKALESDYPYDDFVDFWNLHTNDETARYLSSGSSSLVHHSIPSTEQTAPVEQAISSATASIPAALTYTVRSLIQRPNIKTEAQRTANLILHSLKSYPLMMLRHNTLPPFIHPRSISSDVENTHMEPLTNCISLVHMIGSGVQGSRKLFWRNVRLECERLCEEVC